MARQSKVEHGAAAPSDRQRVATEYRARLANLGIDVGDGESLDDLGLIVEAIEDFELAVESRGGDLMVDEPPAGQRGEPDLPTAALPRRAPGEFAAAFARRIREVAKRVRGATA